MIFLIFFIHIFGSFFYRSLAWQDAEVAYHMTKVKIIHESRKFRFNLRTTSLCCRSHVEVEIFIFNVWTPGHIDVVIWNPIQIEVLKDGFFGTIFSTIDEFSNEGIGLEESSVLRQGWRTARRTINFCVFAHTYFIKWC